MSADRKLFDIWRELAAPILTSDGTNPKFPFDTRNNPNLIELINELSILYLEKCERKFLLLHEKAGLEKKLLKDNSCDIDAVQKNLNDVENRIREFDSQLVTANASALRKLLNSKTIRGISTKGDDQERSANKMAIIFLTPIIQHAVAAACIHSGYVVDITDDARLINAVKTVVPRSFGGK